MDPNISVALGSMPTGVAVAVGVAALTIVQFAKFSGLPDKYGPYCVIVIAILFEVAWIYQTDGPDRHLTLAYLLDTTNMVVSAGGAYGFARAVAPESVTRLRRPPQNDLTDHVVSVNDPVRKD